MAMATQQMRQDTGDDLLGRYASVHVIKLRGHICYMADEREVEGEGKQKEVLGSPLHLHRWRTRQFWCIQEYSLVE